MLRDTTPRSLVLLDEMGKGTEVDSATALSGAMLEQLADRSGTNVIFATHLHGLVRKHDPGSLITGISPLSLAGFFTPSTEAYLIESGHGSHCRWRR